MIDQSLSSSADYNQSLCQFLDASPTPFHAVASMRQCLEAAGYQVLDEAEVWQLKNDGRYFVTRNDSSILAFTTGSQPVAETGWRLFGAHTDSPCLKVKPQPELHRHGVGQLGVEVYGGVLLNPWFDRDLSLAGRVHYRTEGGETQSALINFSRPVAVIPSLAIHLDREANNQRKVNPQTDVPPVMWLSDEKPDFRALLIGQLAEQGITEAVSIVDYDLSFYDHQTAQLIGVEREFLASARLDNLLSCHAGLSGLLAAESGQPSVLICNDHEEVGSQSAVGADGPMLRTVLERIAGSAEGLARALANSWMISADNAHAIHPNFSDRHDGNHGPQLNKGPVIKINANQRYASNSETAAFFQALCDAEEIPVQRFVVRTDMACGSTIGPITAAKLGVRTVDVGVPQWAMHSIRELAGSEDPLCLAKAARRFFSA